MSNGPELVNLWKRVADLELAVYLGVKSPHARAIVHMREFLFGDLHTHLGCQSSTLIREELPPFHLPAQPEPCEGYADYRGL